MAKDSMAKLAGILILLSVFLPVRYLSYERGFVNLVEVFEIYQWMLGLEYITVTTTVFSSGQRSIDTYTRPFLFIPGIIIALVLLLMSVLIILNANSGKGIKVKKKGIISIILLVAVFALFYFVFVLGGVYQKHDAFVFYPYFGFFGILVGGILAIIGGNKMK